MDKQPSHSRRKGGLRLSVRFEAMRRRTVAFYDYCCDGVWRDTRKNWRVSAVKIGNLSVRGFLNADLQTQACALTFRTLLAIVPALALIFAIGRGFGFQNILKQELLDYFPSQHRALEQTFTFVDSYLNQASEGLFVGVGIVFLLWTLISLLGNVEDSFNTIWHVRGGRSMWRKLTDYTAILLVLPVLMICSAGLSVLMSSTLQSILAFDFLKPAINWLLDLASYVFTSLFFAGAYLLIPNTKVRAVNALVAGAAVGVAFQVLQWVFVTGQMYVARYNAIYGTFSFVPLLLIWLQLVWLITLIGGLLCYASQNAGQFSFYKDVDNISRRYYREVTLVVMAIVAKRFVEGKRPLTAGQLAKRHSIPVSLVTQIVLKLRKVGLISFIEAHAEFLEHPLQPAVDVTHLTVGELIRRIQTDGESDFIPGFNEKFGAARDESQRITSAMSEVADETNIVSLNIPS